MQSNLLPNEIRTTLENDFKLNTTPIFCQVATLSQNIPHVRTMRLYGIEDNYGLIFTTRDASRKWSALNKNPNAAICILHPGYQIQLQVECTVKLLHSKDAVELSEKYWSMVRPDVKKIYHDDYVPNVTYQDQSQIKIPVKIPNHLGIIAAIPHFIEYLFIGDDYQSSIRYQYTKSADETWSRLKLTVS